MSSNGQIYGGPGYAPLSVWPPTFPPRATEDILEAAALAALPPPPPLNGIPSFNPYTTYPGESLFKNILFQLRKMLQNIHFQLRKMFLLKIHQQMKIFRLKMWHFHRIRKCLG